MSGKLITFEGGEACGKSTALETIAGALEARGETVLRLREPGGTAFGEAMRTAIKDKTLPATKLAQLFAFNAARAQIITEKIRPALDRGETVICDRFFHSSIVYQQSPELPADTIVQMCDIATGGLKPDLTILFDLPAEVAAQRIAASRQDVGDRFDSADLATMNGWRSEYLKLTENCPYMKVIDASASREKVVEACMEHIEEVCQFSKPLAGGQTITQSCGHRVRQASRLRGRV